MCDLSAARLNAALRQRRAVYLPLLVYRIKGAQGCTHRYSTGCSMPPPLLFAALKGHGGQSGSVE